MDYNKISSYSPDKVAMLDVYVVQFLATHGDLSNLDNLHGALWQLSNIVRTALVRKWGATLLWFPTPRERAGMSRKQLRVFGIGLEFPFFPSGFINTPYKRDRHLGLNPRVLRNHRRQWLKNIASTVQQDASWSLTTVQDGAVKRILRNMSHALSIAHVFVAKYCAGDHVLPPESCGTSASL
jgi:hypothetical protein